MDDSIKEAPTYGGQIICQVQDSIIIDPLTAITPKNIKEMYNLVTQMPLFQVVDYSAAELRVAQAFITAPIATPEPAAPKYLAQADIPHVIRKGAFPNHAPGYGGCGAYGMHRTAVGIRTAAARCLKALTPIADTFDALYVTGQSGVVPASIVAYKLKKELIILRKKGEDSHGAMLEGDAAYVKGIRYIIIDDFVSLAGTMDRLMEYKPPHSVPVAICLYGHPRTDREVHVGFCKVWKPIIESDPRTQADYWVRLVRRGPRSILFDFVIEPGWAPTVV